MLCFSAFINPKAIELKHLFDDIVSSLFRQTGPDNHNFKWIVFDGPIYSDWAENLNTVLDDNRKLCLSSGEILHLMDNMTFIFEVHDLSQASPSTVTYILSIKPKKKENILSVANFRFPALESFTSSQTL